MFARLASPWSEVGHALPSAHRPQHVRVAPKNGSRWPGYGRANTWQPRVSGLLGAGGLRGAGPMFNLPPMLHGNWSAHFHTAVQPLHLQLTTLYQDARS